MLLVVFLSMVFLSFGCRKKLFKQRLTISKSLELNFILTRLIGRLFTIEELFKKGYDSVSSVQELDCLCSLEFQVKTLAESIQPTSSYPS